MTANMGWIKLHRSIKEHWVFNDPVLLRAWIDILLTANHEPRKITVRKQIIVIDRGQFWTSYRKLAIRWNLDAKTVKRSLALLQNDGMIYVDARQSYGTLITVRNYEVYQGFSGEASHNESHNESHKLGLTNPIADTYEQQINNDEECSKNGKNNGLAPGDPYYFEEV